MRNKRSKLSRGVFSALLFILVVFITQMNEFIPDFNIPYYSDSYTFIWTLSTQLAPLVLLLSNEIIHDMENIVVRYVNRMLALYYTFNVVQVIPFTDDSTRIEIWALKILITSVLMLLYYVVVDYLKVNNDYKALYENALKEIDHQDRIIKSYETINDNDGMEGLSRTIEDVTE